MKEATAILDDDDMTLMDTLAPVATLVGGVPLLTMLAMMALRYIASGTI